MTDQRMSDTQRKVRSSYAIRFSVIKLTLDLITTKWDITQYAH